MSKDYISTICKDCGQEFHQPYQSLQENPPKAPTALAVKNTQERLVQDLIYHQNRCPVFRNKARQEQLKTTVIRSSHSIDVNGNCNKGCC